MLGIIYLYITLYIIFCHVPTTLVTRPIVTTLKFVSSTLEKFLTPKKRSIIYSILVTLIIVSIVFSFPESQNSPRLKRLVSLFGIFVFIIITFATSVVSITQPWLYPKKKKTCFLIYLYYSIVNTYSGIRLVLPFSCNSYWHYLYLEHLLDTVYFNGYQHLSKHFYTTLIMVQNLFLEQLLQMPVHLLWMYFPPWYFFLLSCRCFTI